MAATDQLGVDASARIETAAEQLEAWGEEVPKTVRGHSFEHSSDGASISSPEGMPTGNDLQALWRVSGSRFEAAFVELLSDSLKATRALAAGHEADAAAAPDLATDARRSCDTTLNLL